MSDDADRAAELADAAVAAGLARRRPAMPAGVSGECDECGYDRPRLVAGRCGYCRDGREPPENDPAWTAPARPAPAAPSPPKEKPVSDHVNISVHVRDEVAATVRRLADERGEPLSRVALTLIQRAIADLDRAEAAPATPAVVDLSTVPADWLSAEIGRRLAEAIDPASLLHARQRADTAEARLARVAAAFGEEGA